MHKSVSNCRNKKSNLKMKKRFYFSVRKPGNPFLSLFLPRATGLPGCGGSLIMYKIREYTASQKNQHRSTEVSPNAVFKEIIQYNTLRCVQQIIHASTRLDLPLWSLQDKVDVDLIEQIVNEIRTTHFCFNQGSINPELGKKLKIIWSLSVRVNNLGFFFLGLP